VWQLDGINIGAGGGGALVTMTAANPQKIADKLNARVIVADASCLLRVSRRRFFKI
jgi:hypothetical protein